MEVLVKGPILDWTKDGKTSRTFPRMEKEGVDFTQRSCNDQGRPGVCLSMHLSVVG